MDSKGAAIIGLCIAGILMSLISLWILFYAVGSSTMLGSIAAFICLAVGIFLIVMGLKSP